MSWLGVSNGKSRWSVVGSVTPEMLLSPAPMAAPFFLQRHGFGRAAEVAQGRQAELGEGG